MGLMNRAAAWTPGKSVAVADSSTPVASENRDRAEIVVTNDSDATVYLRLASTGAALGQGIRLNAAGGSYSSTEYRGPISAIHAAAGAAKNLCVSEV